MMHDKDIWGWLEPDVVSESISFKAGDFENTYVLDKLDSERNMADKQTEGVSFLWNTLDQKRIALLADEVGMGKTFQAIGVFCLLWKTKPNARVLVIAPNESICSNWLTEYETFVREHYKVVDNLVKNTSSGGVVHKAHYCKNLNDFKIINNEGWCQLQIMKISSLSTTLRPDAKEWSERRLGAFEGGNDIRESILENSCQFDLLIIDESQYFRNYDGDSLRVASAKALFGDNLPLEERLAKRVLLMTATPSHSRQVDVNNMVKYFDKALAEKSTTDILNDVALRRFRLMQGKDERSFNKYHYRSEEALPADFQGDNQDHDIDAELFFALYQKMLVEKVEPKTERGLMYGYLEGFESIGTDINKKKGRKKKLTNEEIDAEKDAQDGGTTEFVTAPDTDVLDNLTAAFQDSYKSYPSHPKYDTICDELNPKKLWDGSIPLYENKHLVFVRRIPSIRELTQRSNRLYDNLFAEKIAEAWGFSSFDVDAWRADNFSRDFYMELIKKKEPIDKEDELEDALIEEDLDEEDVSEKYFSSVMGLFSDKKEGANVKSTHATNFRKRFKNRNSPFVLFFRPASDYHSTPYYFAFNLNKDGKTYYKFAGERARADSSQVNGDKIFKAKLCGKHWAEGKYDKHDINPVETLFSVAYNVLDSYHKNIMESWASANSQSYECAEAFSNYFENGVLYASTALIEIYGWYIEIENNFDRSDAVGNYIKFMTLVKERLPKSVLLRYLKEAIESYQILVEKLVGKRLDDWSYSWRVFTNLQSPAFFASSEIQNRKRLIIGFNSPFFPNIISSTSVFQEGVNLHLNCKNVHHYGVAWTPGDNEQRVGRVDRLFGCVNRVLKEDGKGELRSTYPYLKNTFDQEQIANFICMKYRNENLLDRCTSKSVSREVQLIDNHEDWQAKLRVADFDNGLEIAEDPYPYRKIGLNQDRQNYKPERNSGEDEILSYLENTILAILREEETLYVADKSNEINMFYIDPKFVGENSHRYQPVLVERHFSSEFSGMVDGSVYYITLKTPLASKQELEAEYKLNTTLKHIYDHYDDAWKGNELVQIAIDSEKENSQFYLHMKVDLPLFVRNDGHSLLSTVEVNAALRQLINCADRVERTYFENKDIRIENIDGPIGIVERNLDMLVQIKSPKETNSIGDRWFFEKTGSKVAYLKSCTRSNQQNKLKKLKYKEMLELVHEYPFVNLWSNHASSLYLYLPFPAEDFQKEEQELLEKWFDFVQRRLVEM